MNKTLIILISFLVLQSCTQTKIDYLEKNRFDLSSTDFDFPQRDFNIIGFGAYHGSAETENVELKLLESLTKEGLIKYYLPEVDYSTAHFYNNFLQTGDTTLLKELVVYNGNHVTQERTIEFYEKWKKIKTLNDSLPLKSKLKVLGIEWIRNYKYVSKHLLELVEDDNETLIPITEIKEMVKLDTTSYSLGDLSFAYHKLKGLIVDYEEKKELYKSKINDIQVFEHILKNIKISFEKKVNRDKIIYENYLALAAVFDFKNNSQFLRIGFSHIEKSREGKEGYPYFFTRLIENEIYSKDKVLSIIGYLTNSKVVWNETFDDKGNYNGFTVEAGYGIGDYKKEYFRGIQNLKSTKISDKTLFRLNKKNSPYLANEPDLIEVIMLGEKSNGENVKGMSTLDFLDYAILISDSKESIPIYEMK
jgi:hypothetical protein